MTTQGASTPGSTPVIHNYKQLPDSQLSPDYLQKSNLAKLKAALGGTLTIKTPLDKASVIAARITDAASLKDELGIDLTGISGSTFAITASGKADGTISISATMTTSNATTPGSNPITHDFNQLSDAELVANKLQVNNLAKLKAALGGTLKIKASTDKASAIAGRITDAASLKDELGIDLTGITGSTFAITATAATDGTISISVTMTTPNATTPASTVVNHNYNQTPDAELDANALQVNNLAKLKAALAGKATIKVPTDKASDIASRITNAASLKRELGIDLTGIIGSWFVIHATGLPNGTISITATMTTPGATTPASAAATHDYQQTSDAQIAANKLIADKIAKIKAALARTATIKVPTDKASAIAGRITDAASLKDELGIDLTGISGSTLTITATGATDGTITVSVTVPSISSTAMTNDYHQIPDAEITNFIENEKTIKTIIPKNAATNKKEGAAKDKTAQEISDEINNASSDSVKKVIEHNLGIFIPELLGAGKYKVSSQVTGDGELSIDVTFEQSGIKSSQTAHFVAHTYEDDEVAKYVEDHKSKGLSLGITIGIIALGVFALITMIPAGIYLYKRKKKNK